MKFLLRSVATLALMLPVCPRAAAQMGQEDFSKCTGSINPVRGNVSVLRVTCPDDDNNLLVLDGPEGYLLVDHPEAASNAILQKLLDELGKRPVRFVVNTHWHYDHVGGNEIYAPGAVVVAHENVRARLMTQQKPWWSPTPIGPYPQRAWPRVSYRDELSIHFDGENVTLAHYGVGHTDGDSIVYFENANVVDVGDLFHGKGHFSGGADMQGIAKVLAAVVAKINDATIVVPGHGAISNRRDLAEYVNFLNDTIASMKEQIAAGKTDAEIQAAGLPEKWQAWPAVGQAAVREFLHYTYNSLTKPDLNQ
ncbi:MAG TPA: MBL fold metallo-hydrolase [Candidatus Limnocylindrales bacterium]|nr:MBL fold metallo-hydrolase [Candidatus Limnocylindrales bacterium]